MKDAEKARKLLDVISVVASNVVEKRLDNVVQTKLAYVTSITYNTNGNAIYRVRLSSSNSDEFECPKLCINELSVGDYVWLNYIGDITNAYIAMPVEPSPAQDVIRNTVAYNLLDNSDFTNPVNQRGQTSYNTTVAGYTIDRWRKSAKLFVTVNDGYISLSLADIDTAYGDFYQNLENYDTLAGKPVTFAFSDADNNIYVQAFNLGQNTTGNQLGNIIVYSTSGQNVLLRATGDCTIKWAALYEGEYTAATLPKYMPKGYAAELLNCQRTYVPKKEACGFSNTAGTAIFAVVTLPTKMRLDNPTIETESSLSVRCNGTAIPLSEIQSVSAIGSYGNDVEIQVQLSSTTLAGNFPAYLYGGMKIIADI